MKLLTITILFSFISFQESNAQDSKKLKAEIMFETNMHNFKKIEFNDSESYFDFKFKNIGKAPLTISKIETTCGCTIAEKPEAPIAKKAKDYIRIWYDSKRVGKFSKTITVYSDAVNSPTQLMIKGEVKPEDKSKKVENNKK